MAKLINNPEEKFRGIQDEAFVIFCRKNKDYGQAYVDYGIIGIATRMGDKLKRLMTITDNKIELVPDEKLRDTLLDFHNYSAMAVMLLDESVKSKNDKL
jgi:hypothetical protein